VSALAQFEQFVQGLVEGSVHRLMRSRVEPVEIAKRVAQAMEHSAVIGVDRVVVPNRYTVRLHPDDQAALAPLSEHLRQELTTYVKRLAAERDFTLLKQPTVTFAGDQRVTAGAIRVDATHADGYEPAEGGRGDLFAAERTQHMRAVAPAGPREARGPAFVRIDPAGAGWRHRLSTVTRIGRAFDNDMVLEERTVSRNHAEVRRESDGYHIVDLGSTNGIRVNGRRVKSHLLRPGDRVQLGNVEFAFDPNPD